MRVSSLTGFLLPGLHLYVYLRCTPAQVEPRSRVHSRPRPPVSSSPPVLTGSRSLQEQIAVAPVALGAGSRHPAAGPANARERLRNQRLLRAGASVTRQSHVNNLCVSRMRTGRGNSWAKGGFA